MISIKLFMIRKETKVTQVMQITFPKTNIAMRGKHANIIPRPVFRGNLLQGSNKSKLMVRLDRTFLNFLKYALTSARTACDGHSTSNASWTKVIPANYVPEKHFAAIFYNIKLYCFY